MGEPGRLPSMGSHRVGHNRSDLVAAAASYSLSSSTYTIMSSTNKDSYMYLSNLFFFVVLLHWLKPPNSIEYKCLDQTFLPYLVY